MNFMCGIRFVLKEQGFVQAHQVVFLDRKDMPFCLHSAANNFGICKCFEFFFSKRGIQTLNIKKLKSMCICANE